MIEGNVEVDSPYDWLVLPVESSKRTCSRFRECSILLYEFLLTQINFWLPLFEFKVEALRFLKVPPRSFIPVPRIL